MSKGVVFISSHADDDSTSESPTNYVIVNYDAFAKTPARNALPPLPRTFARSTDSRDTVTFRIFLGNSYKTRVKDISCRQCTSFTHLKKNDRF